ncbi:MAG: glycosyltransferase family 39 protein [Phycisphaerales bacterium]|nr:glycosyltransferase family 39 protein [Phycisphaerales bacterium]
MSNAPLPTGVEPVWRRRLLIFALVIAAIFAGLRFVRVDADLPPGITPSFSLFTDEGIYARNAANFAAGRPWRVPTDYNTGVNYPAFSAPQALVFGLFGANMAVARGLNAVYSIILIALLASLLWRCVSPLAASVMAALALSNYVLFFFSRFAHLDIPMAMWLALALLMIFAADRPVSIARGVGIGVAFALAMLTKTNAFFALPALLWGVWSQSRFASGLDTPTTPKARLKRVIAPIVAMGSACAILLAAYGVFIVVPFLDDYRVVAGSVISDRLRLNPATLAYGVWRMLAGGTRIDLLLYPLGLLVGLVVIVRDARVRPIAVALLLWIVMYAGLMGTQGGARPTRYYLPVAAPVMALVGVGVEFVSRRKANVVVALAVGGVAASFAWNSYKVARDLADARYTFRDAAMSIRDHIRADGVSEPLMLGHIAGNLGLYNGVPSVGSHFGRETERWQAFDLSRFRPTHFVSYGPIAPLQQRLLSEAGYEWELEDRYEIMGSYYRDGGGTCLYRLISPVSDLP